MALISHRTGLLIASLVAVLIFAVVEYNLLTFLQNGGNDRLLPTICCNESQSSNGFSY